MRFKLALLAALISVPVLAAKPEAKAPRVDWALLQTMDSASGKASANLEKFDGQMIRVPGFMVPLDFSEKREVTEFLLTPAYPGCLHVPPPTPNQTILVKMAKGKRAAMSWGPIFIQGRLKLVKQPKTGYGEASFEMEGDATEPFTDINSGDHIPGSVLPKPKEHK